MIRYCRACEVAELTGHPAFARVLAGRDNPPDLVYLWTDGSVTDLPIAGAEPILASDGADWAEFRGRIWQPAPAA